MVDHDDAGPTILREVERKLRIGDAFVLPDLETEVHGLVVGPPTVETLVATYHDTADLRLARNGATLRFRRSSGRGTWTLKVEDPLAERRDGSLDRREIRSAGTRTRVPASLRSALAPFVGAGSVAPVAVLRTDRTSYDLVLDGVRIAELVDDRVAVEESPAGPSAFRELEVELVEGATDVAGIDAVLHEIVAALVAGGAKEGPGIPKLHRALGDALPEPDTLGRRSTVGDMARSMVERGLRQLVLHEVGIRTRRDAEDVHGARVATRRLRSDLSTLRAAVDLEWLTAIRSDLSRLAGALGDVRDLDVLHERFVVDLRDAADGAEGHGAGLLAHLEDQRASRLEALLAELDTDAHRALLERLHRAAVELPRGEHAERNARDVAAEIVDRNLRRLHRAARRADHVAPDEELHAVRILAKRCRYAAEMVRPVLPRARRIAKVASEAQEVLGELNDASVARTWLEAVGPTLDGPGAFVAGMLAGAERVRAASARAGWPDARRKVRDVRER